ncbi:hypothetical protein SMICM17S_06325 [Streptomyces microflavus]
MAVRRKKSVYAMASARTGKKTGPRRVRATAGGGPNASTAVRRRRQHQFGQQALQDLRQRHARRRAG